jgi:PAS domain S-box-containing protein
VGPVPKDVDAPFQSPTEELTRVRGCLTDLASIMALAAPSTGGEPSQILIPLLDSLLGTLRLAFVVVRVNDPEGGPSSEMIRVAESLSAAGRSFSLATAGLGLNGEIGIVVAGSERSDFPAQTDRLVLDVAANQATIRLQQAQLRSEQTRLARLRERDARSIMDSIPVGIALMTPDGEVEVVNRQMVESFGRTFEALEHWVTGEKIHPEDRSRAVECFQRSVATGDRFDNEQRHLRVDGVYQWFRVLAVPLRDVNGDITRWCVVHVDITERKRTEQALRDSERESRLIVDTIPGLVAILAPSGEVDVVNQQLVDYCGQPLEAMKQWGTNGTVHVEDLAHVVPVFTQAIMSGEPYDFEARIRRSDGIYRWFQVRGLPLRDPGGQIARWYVLLSDIDDRKRAEDALRANERHLKLSIDTLRQSERQFRLLVETIPALVWRGTPEGELDYLNRRAVEWLGHTAESLTGGRWLELVHPDHRDRTVQRWLHSATTGTSYADEYQLRRADGQYRWIQSVGEPFHDAEGRIAHWYGLVIDIEDRKRADGELRRAYDSFTDAQRLSHTGSFITDLVGDDHNWSEEAFRIFEFDTGSKVSVERIRNIIHPDDLPSFESVIARGMKGENVDFAFRIVTDRGAVKHVRGVAHVVERVAGRPLFVGALQDVTESKVAEEALNRARSELAHVARVTTVGALTASIAHEVNQPLSGIITNAGTCLRMLAADPPDIAGARETARRTLRDGNRAADVISRLRALFSKKEFTLESLDLNDATREVVALSLSELQRNRIVLQSEFADGLPMITGDRIQLQQVMLNLLRNASDAMAGVDDRPRQLLIRTERDEGDRVRLTVRDAGVGLDPQSMNKLFDAFYTTKTDGMGIGLAVSRSIIERHHGRLWAEPNDGSPGATFSFWIPGEAQSPNGVAGAGTS